MFEVFVSNSNPFGLYQKYYHPILFVAYNLKAITINAHLAFLLSVNAVSEYSEMILLIRSNAPKITFSR